MNSKDFETVKDMRWRMVVEGIYDFSDYLASYDGNFDRKQLGKLWYKATSLKKDENWRAFLRSRLFSYFNEFSNAVNELVEEGVGEDDIAASLGMGIESIRWIATSE